MYPRATFVVLMLCIYAVFGGAILWMGFSTQHAAVLVAVMIMVSIGTFSWNSSPNLKRHPWPSSVVMLTTVVVVVDGAGAGVPLVNADAERLPFADRSFDVVMCDHGAMTFARADYAVGTAPVRAETPKDGLVLADFIDDLRKAAKQLQSEKR